MAGVAGRSGGRGAKPTQDHQRRGTYREDRHGGFESPDPPKGAPIPPKPLEGDAKAEWDRVCEDLEACKTLASVDRSALYQYCCLFAETEALAAKKDINLYVAIRQNRMAMRTYLVEFGLTPASRSRVKIAKKEDPGSKWDGLVN